MTPPGKVSKNARSGVKSVQKKRLCSVQHEMVNVFFVGFGMRLTCACSGYTPIDVKLPYVSIKAPEPIGKAGMSRNKGSCYPQGSKP